MRMMAISVVKISDFIRLPIMMIPLARRMTEGRARLL